MDTKNFFKTPLEGEKDIILIGMAGCGKSTLGKELAQRLDYAQVDTDFLIESAYGLKLQQITDNMTRDEFLDLERDIICDTRIFRSVISTGGSVIYRDATMEHLKKFGTIVHLDVSLPIILERIAKNPDRGLVIAEGQTIESLFAEREALYKKWADVSVKLDDLSINECVNKILGLI